MQLAKNSKTLISLTPSMANRHGLIAGATGTGKTVTLQKMAEEFALQGIPVFMADVKGDLSGMAAAGQATSKLTDRLAKIGSETPAFQAFPVAFWDVFGQKGIPVRTTVSEMGPLLLARLLDLNDTQAGVLNTVFEIADREGLLILDLKDLQSTLQYAADHAAKFRTELGNISSASVGTIQRALTTLKSQGGESFFGEPALTLQDFLAVSYDGKGFVHILAADQLMQSPRVYSTLLLWLLAELFEQLPEAGDLDKPKLVFFFDEAHLLFKDAPKALLEKIEQVVRLIRSRGVGIYFVTQNPLDIPETVLAQLGNRVQHALRAFTPQDEKAVKTAARTFRPNPAFSTETAITELAVGEALISFLDASGTPQVTERAWVLPPRSQIGIIDNAMRNQIVERSPLRSKYATLQDRESAYEILKSRAENQTLQQNIPQQTASQGGFQYQPQQQAPAQRGTPGRKPDSMVDIIAKSAARSVASSVGRQIVRGVLGSIFGGGRRR